MELKPEVQFMTGQPEIQIPLPQPQKSTAIPWIAVLFQPSGAAPGAVLYGGGSGETSGANTAMGCGSKVVSTPLSAFAPFSLGMWIPLDTGLLFGVFSGRRSAWVFGRSSLLSCSEDVRKSQTGKYSDQSVSIYIQVIDKLCGKIH